jgi:predicted alpha/beta-hydrolase family hydrolase
MHDEAFGVETSRGEVPVEIAAAGSAGAAAPILIVAHGAGAGMHHPFITGFTDAMNQLGVATARFDLPYMAAKKKTPDPAPVAVAAWKAVFEAVSERAGGGRKGAATQGIWAGGKSYGGRIASMAVADGMPAAGLVFLGYPLHPPGRADKIRDEHLYAIKVPMLFLHGSRDAFADAELLDEVVGRLGKRAMLERFDGADHSFNVRGQKRSPKEVGASLAPAVARFILER